MQAKEPQGRSLQNATVVYPGIGTGFIGTILTVLTCASDFVKKSDIIEKSDITEKSD